MDSGLISEKNDCNKKSAVLSFIINVLIAAGAATILSAIILFLTSFVFLAAGIDDSAINVTVLVVRGIAVFAAGFWASGRTKKFGFLSGLLTGISSVMISALIGLLICDASVFDGKFPIDLAVSSGAGFIGGISGINLRKK